MKVIYSPCSGCGALNRLDLGRLTAGKTARCSRCKAELPLHGPVNEVDARGLGTLVRSCPLPVIVDFWAPWCGPCRTFAPVFEQTAGEMAGELVFAKLDTERHPEAASRFHIQAIPTLVLFRGGNEVDRRSGALPPAPFRDWLRTA